MTAINLWVPFYEDMPADASKHTAVINRRYFMAQPIQTLCDKAFEGSTSEVDQSGQTVYSSPNYKEQADKIKETTFLIYEMLSNPEPIK